MYVYLAGKMTGIPHFNYELFMAAAAKLRAKGHTVFNPVEEDVQSYGYELFTCPKGDPSVAVSNHGFDLRDTLAKDLNWLCRYADAIALLPGWRDSKGATAEHATAVALGLKIIELEPLW